MEPSGDSLAALKSAYSNNRRRLKALSVRFSYGHMFKRHGDSIRGGVSCADPFKVAGHQDQLSECHKSVETVTMARAFCHR